jgi:hypothetical protein
MIEMGMGYDDSIESFNIEGEGLPVLSFDIRAALVHPALKQNSRCTCLQQVTGACYLPGRPNKREFGHLLSPEQSL